jgi:hypothetical protein
MFLEATVGSSLELDGSSGAVAAAPTQSTLEDVTVALASALRGAGFELTGALGDAVAAAGAGEVFAEATRPQLQAFLRVLLGTAGGNDDVLPSVCKVCVCVRGVH